MKEVNDYLDYESIWEDVRPLNIGCLEDYQTELNGLSIEDAEDFIKEPIVPINVEECYVSGTEVHLSFGMECSDKRESLSYIHLITDMKYDGAVTYIEKGTK